MKLVTTYLHRILKSVTVPFIVLSVVISVFGLSGTAARAETAPARLLPDTIAAGDEFEVVITYVPPQAISVMGLTDTGPDGWVTAEIKNGVSPSAHTKFLSNEAEFIWMNDIAAGTTITVRYRVTVPDNAVPGTYSFSGELLYYLGSDGPFKTDTGGESSIVIPSTGGTPTPSGNPPESTPPVTPVDTTYTVVTDDFTGGSTLVVDDLGIVQSSVTLVTDDNDVQLTISSGTILLNGDGTPLQSLTAQVLANPPAPPTGSTIALACDFGPDGASFSVPVAITMTYDPSILPQGTDENRLRVAYWNGSAWVLLETTVDTLNNTLTCYTDHFTPFAVMTAAVTAGQSELPSSGMTDTAEQPSSTTGTDTPVPGTDSGDKPAVQPVTDETGGETAVEENDTGVEPTGIKWWVIGVIAAVVVIIGIVLYFNLRRSRY